MQLIALLTLLVLWSEKTAASFPKMERIVDLGQELQDAYPQFSKEFTFAYFVNRQGDALGSGTGGGGARPFIYSGTTTMIRVLPCPNNANCDALFMSDRLNGRPDEVIAVGFDYARVDYVVVWHIDVEAGKVLDTRRVKPPASLLGDKLGVLYGTAANRLGLVLMYTGDKRGEPLNSIVYNFFTKEFKVLSIKGYYGVLSMNNRGDVVGTNKLGIYQGNNKWKVVTVPPPTPTDTFVLSAINNKRLIVSLVGEFPDNYIGRYQANPDGSGSWDRGFSVCACIGDFAYYMNIAGDFTVGFYGIYSNDSDEFLTVPDDLKPSECLTFYGGSISADFFLQSMNNANAVAGNTFDGAVLILPKSTKACAANCVDRIECSCREFLRDGSKCWLKQAKDETRCYTPAGEYQRRRHLVQVQHQFRVKCIKEGRLAGWYP